MKLGNKADTMMNEKMSWEGIKELGRPAIQDYFTTGIVIPLWVTSYLRLIKQMRLTEQHWDFSTAHALNYPLENLLIITIKCRLVRWILRQQCMHRY